MRTLFVISDLHLGGRPHDHGADCPGFQFNHAYAALTNFIDWIGIGPALPSDMQAELVINGDIVDFLAEDDYAGGGAQVWTGSEDEAIGKLELIASRTRGPDGRGVFESLRDFVNGGNFLTLLLGNHDVELALPRVRQKLLDLLGGENARIRFVYDGEAYTVGRVLIEHGNRYDRWNMIDHSALRQERSVLSRRLALDESQRADQFFVPPAGTHLVVHVINRIKSRYRFIDLLKPETNASIPLLLALEPDIAPYIKKLLATPVIAEQFFKYKLASAATPYNKGALARDRSRLPSISLKQVLVDTVGRDDASAFLPVENGMDRELGAEKLSNWFLARRKQAIETVNSLSCLLKIRASAMPEERRRQLHIALKALNENDRSYRLEEEDSIYLDAATTTLGTGHFDAVVYGHTHLPKKIQVGKSCSAKWYLNTGTWCDVIRLPPALSAPYEAAGQALGEFGEALKHNDLSTYTKRYLSYAELRVDLEAGGRLDDIQLYSYCGDGMERSAPLTPYSG